jgi:predicted ferric reductase
MKKYLLYALFAVNLIVIVAFWYHSSGILLGRGFLNVMISLGRLWGLLAVYFILMQFVLIGRNVWVERTFGLDNLTRIHKWNGYLSLGFILLHPIFIVIGYSHATGMSFVGEFLDLIKNTEDVLNAFLGLVLFLFIVGFSISIARKRLKYETWYAVHLSTYAAVLLAWGHQLNIGEDFLHMPAFTYYWYALYIAVLGTFVYSRIVKPLYLSYRHQFTVSRIVRETDSASSIYITGRDMANYKIEPGQFMILRFLTKSMWWQAHPFSLSIVPDKTAANGELRVTVKAVGDFTNQIKAIAPGTKLIIDGPYGAFTELFSVAPKTLFIAGGIGITPIRSLMEQFLKKGKDATLLYANRSEKDVVFKDELAKLGEQYHAPIVNVMSDQPDYAGEKGRLDKEKIKRLVPDVASREVYLCGPIPMIKSLVPMLQELGIPHARIHYEKFAL